MPENKPIIDPNEPRFEDWFALYWAAASIAATVTLFQIAEELRRRAEGE